MMTNRAAGMTNGFISFVLLRDASPRRPAAGAAVTLAVDRKDDRGYFHPADLEYFPSKTRPNQTGSPLPLVSDD